MSFLALTGNIEWHLFVAWGYLACYFLGNYLSLTERSTLGKEAILKGCLYGDVGEECRFFFVASSLDWERNYLEFHWVCESEVNVYWNVPQTFKNCVITFVQLLLDDSRLFPFPYFMLFLKVQSSCLPLCPCNKSGYS